MLSRVFRYLFANVFSPRKMAYKGTKKEKTTQTPENITLMIKPAKSASKPQLGEVVDKH